MGVHASGIKTSTSAVCVLFVHVYKAVHEISLYVVTRQVYVVCGYVKVYEM